MKIVGVFDFAIIFINFIYTKKYKSKVLCKGIIQFKLIFIGMKLIKTIKHLIEEAEENLYLASQRSSNPKELRKLEKEVSDSIKLLKIYKKIGQKD